MDRIKNFFKKLGPGIITGASDDDPSGIATYSIAGAKSQYSLLWTAFLTFPLMVSVQEMVARIGLVTGKGLAGNIREHYPKLFLYFVSFLTIVAITINIGADISGMAASIKLIIPIPTPILALSVTALVIILLVYFDYKTIAKNLKWLTFTLFAYILAAFITRPDWPDIMKNTFLPQIAANPGNISLIVAIFGTTISPYLFFWQASEEVEEKEAAGQIQSTRQIQIVTKHELKGMREDVALGMLFSNIVMFSIIATVASTLYPAGIHDIQTADQAAQALKPLAGTAASFLFAAGIVGTGLLAIPVLAGAAAYAVSESFGWSLGLSKRFHEAKSFYLVIIAATLVGFGISIAGFNPFKILFYTAVIYGLLSPFLIAVILHLANKKKVMGAKTNGWLSNLGGALTFLIMLAAAVALFVVK